MSSCGGTHFSKLHYVREFLNIWFQKLTDISFKISVKLGKFYWTFNLKKVFLAFWDLENVYPPKGICKTDTEGGPIIFTYFLFCVRKRILDFQFTDGFLPFWDLENVLFPEGTLLCRVPKEVQLFLLILSLS